MSLFTARLFDMVDNEPRPPVRIEIVCSDRSASGSTQTEIFEIPRAEWDAMSPAERRKTCDNVADETAYNRFSWGWNISEPADYASTEEPK